MKFNRTNIEGAHYIEIEPHRDDRGFFARVFCPDEFAKAGIQFVPAQDSISRNLHAYTLRGMHFQEAPDREAKLVHVVRGAAYDVIVDLRPDSVSYCKWQSFDLSADKASMIYVPPGCAHGFLTLEDNTDILYRIDRMFVPGHANGVRWNDPVFGIKWPTAPNVISSADQSWPDFCE